MFCEVTYTDGTSTWYENVWHERIDSFGVLTLSGPSNEQGERKPVVSMPLTSVKKWRWTER